MLSLDGKPLKSNTPTSRDTEGRRVTQPCPHTRTAKTRMAPNEPVEVELKLLLPAHARAALKRHRALQAPCATAPETRQEHTVYFDTPLLSLAGKGLSLRVRRCGATRVQTLKSEYVDALALRFAGRCRAAGSDRAWLHDRRQASRQASTLQPDEDGRAIVASRRFVFTRSPAFVGISDGTTTSHRWPRRVSWR